MKKIALVAGGLSSESEISLQTGQAFERALKELGYDYRFVHAGPNLPVELFNLKPDVALLALHGKLAEDGTVQGICEYLKIPYSGSGVLSSALAMNKVKSKEVLQHNGLPTPKWQVIEFDKTRTVDEQLAEHSDSVSLPLPIVVKPARDGSSVGLSICTEKDQLQTAIALAFKYDQLVLAEEYISGKEVTVPVLGDKALSSIEIIPKEGFYDYENKYTAGKTDYVLPAPFASELLDNLAELALKACKVLDIRSYARVDFRVNEKNEPFILEVNTLPGCTETSLVPKAAAHDGISFSNFIKQLVESASLDYDGVS